MDSQSCYELLNAIESITKTALEASLSDPKLKELLEDLQSSVEDAKAHVLERMSGGEIV